VHKEMEQVREPHARLAGFHQSLACQKAPTPNKQHAEGGNSGSTPGVFIPAVWSEHAPSLL
jgi:hypothetical protein